LYPIARLQGAIAPAGAPVPFIRTMDAERPERVASGPFALSRTESHS
jgi:hypothetical protein